MSLASHSCYYFISGPCLNYLLKRPDFQITIACLDKESAVTLGQNKTRSIFLNVNEIQVLEMEIAQHDIVISLIPYSYHAQVIQAAIKYKKHVVTTR